MPRRHTSPVLEPSERDLDAVAPLVSALVVLDRRLTLLSARHTGAYPLVFQRFAESVCVIATIPTQPANLWQATE